MNSYRRSFFCLAFAALALLAAVSATDTYMTVYTDRRKTSMKVSLANFGYFKYGHRLNGRVQVALNLVDWGESVNKDRYPVGQGPTSTPTYYNLTDVENHDLSGCSKDFQQFNEDYLSHYGSPIFFVRRGNCSFTRKARNAAKSGKMLIIGDTSDQEDVDKIIMGDDFSGEKVMIPVVMVSSNDARYLQEFLYAEMSAHDPVNQDKQVWISIVFNKPHEGEVAAVQYWMVPAEKSSYVFFKKHQDFMNKLIADKKITFEPHFVFFRCDEECKKSSKQSQDNMDLFCLFDGKFCNLDPDGNGPLNGVDAVTQSVNELCIYKHFPQYFMTYFFFYHQCYVEKQGGLKACDYDAKKFVTKTYLESELVLNFNHIIQECFIESTITKPDLLENEYNLQKQWGIKFFPALFVNGDIFRGDLKMQEATEEFICQGIEHQDQVELCKEYARIQDDNDIDGNFETQREAIQQQINDENNTTIFLVCLVLFIVFLVGLFVYRRKIRLEVNKELALQVDSAIQQYYTLNESK